MSKAGRCSAARTRRPNVSSEARDALKNAYDLAPDDPDVTVAYAEVLALSSPERRIEGEPRTLIENVLKKTPDHQRGLWLLGISDYQQKKYDSAIGYWNKLIARAAERCADHQVDQGGNRQSRSGARRQSAAA